MREEIMKPLCFLLGFIAALILCEAAASHVFGNVADADTALSAEPLKNTNEKKEKKISKEKKKEKKKGDTKEEKKEKKESPKPEKGAWAIAAAFQPLFYSSC